MAVHRTPWQRGTRGRAARLPTGWGALRRVVLARDHGQCMVRWDAGGWSTGMSMDAWYERIAHIPYAIGLSVDTLTVCRVWTRMTRPTYTGIGVGGIVACTGIATCIDHVMTAGVLSAWAQESTRDEGACVPDRDTIDNLQAACSWCNEAKNRWERIRTPRLSKFRDHPGYL